MTVFWMATLIVFMFLLLLYGLVHRNKFILASSFIGMIVYFIALQPILTDGGTVKEYQLKKEWPTIQTESNGNYAEHLTLLKRSFAHNSEISSELAYYGFAVKFHNEVSLAIMDEKAIKHLPIYDVALHTDLTKRMDFYKNLTEQHRAMTLPKDSFYQEVHTAFQLVLNDLSSINQQSEYLQAQLQVTEKATHEKLISEHTEQLVMLLKLLSQHEKQLNEKMEELSEYLETTISSKLNL